MSPEKVNYYEACDRAIRQMNRENVELFGRLKLAKFDEVSVIKTVVGIYEQSMKRARKKYFEIAFEAYILGLMMCEVESKKAHKMAEKAITMSWVDKVLSQTDFVTLYRFYSETERKAYKLAETLEATTAKNREIDKALRYWSQQLGQYAINVTDYAVVQAFRDAGVAMLQWVSEKDNRVCNECYALNGQVFLTDEVPRKPHWGCRCTFRPVLNGDSRTAG